MLFKNQIENNDAHFLSENEVIEKLKDYGLQIGYKPIAIVPIYMGDSGNMIEIGVEEMNIYDALNTIENRKKVIKNKDPFSNEI